MAEANDLLASHVLHVDLMDDAVELERCLVAVVERHGGAECLTDVEAIVGSEAERRADRHRALGHDRSVVFEHDVQRPGGDGFADVGRLDHDADVAGDEADFSVVQPESWTLDGFTELKEDAQFLKKAAKTLKRIKYYRNLKTAFTQGYATEGLIGITGRLKGGWKAIKDQRKLVRASRNPATSAAKLKAAAALEFVSELNDAGYLSIDGLSRNNGYRSVADLAGTSTFTDCLEDKYRLAL